MPAPSNWMIAMRVFLTIALLSLTLAGCKTSGDIRARQIEQVATSAKSVDELAGCIALAMSGHGMEIGQEMIAGGIAVTIAMRNAGIKTVTDVFDIVDRGADRTVTLFSVAGKRSSKPLGGPAAKCI